ncbi:GNAT family N-acetyltransferase [Patescibacteria group bacterium]|nr:GNAT family N-acetyltransferase [Patescibacteria group bacterium]MCL5798312.1 GNAT family N-acetyltransferase [Patescibacteria group bacterium]
MVIKKFSIRRATIDDLDDVLVVEKSAFPPHRQGTRETFETRLSLYPKGFFVVEVDGIIRGFSTALIINNIISVDKLDIPDNKLHNLQGDVYELRSLAIVKEFQLRGLGKQLVNKQLQNAIYFKKKYCRFTASQDVSRFYEKLGFKQITPYINFHHAKQALWERIL